MIEFKPVRLEDKQTIERYTMPSGIYNCDLAFANMYCWQAMYHSAWAVIDGFLVIRFQIGGGEKIGYMQPVGEGDFARIIPALREDAHAHGQRLRIIGLTDEGREMVRNMHAGLFAFESDRGMEDYVYNADDLRNLTGRRYQPKRNHINRFMAEYPDFRYEQLTRERFGECMQLEREWRRSHEGHTSELCAEQRAMQRAFEHFEELEMIGGCIYVGDKLIAFTYGSAVNDHTFDTHVEKADTDYDGAFTIINKLFAQHLPRRHPAQICGHPPAPGRNRLQGTLDGGIRRRRTIRRLVPDALLQPPQDADGRMRRAYGGHAPHAAVRERAGTVDLHLRRSDSARIPPQGTGRQADTRSDAAHRRAGRRGGLPDPERGVAARVLCKIRLRRRRTGDILIARRLRFRDGRRLERQGHGLAASPRGSAARGTALHLRQEVVPPCCAATQGAISHPRQESRRLYSLRLSVLHIVT